MSNTPDPIALPELPKSLDSVRVMARGVPESARPHGHYYNVEQLRAYGQARYEAGRAAQAKHQQQQVGHLPKDAIAWLDMGKGEAQLMFGKRDASNRANKRQLTMLFEKVNPGYHPLYLHPQEEVATPPLNELLGQREEFNLNEVSGNSGQLASLEQRARELAQGIFATLRNAQQTRGLSATQCSKLADDVVLMSGFIAGALSAQKGESP